MVLAFLLAGAPSRIPAGFDPEGVPVTDRLASWVPADAAAVFFESLAAAEEQVGGLAGSLPRVLPPLRPGSAEAGDDALARAVETLLLPPIWRANPGVRTGTRQVAIVASDPDLRRAADVALLCEVDDATLVRTHRLATFSWEDRSPRRLRVEGLDAWTEDGAVRSFFALGGGVAVWSTTRSLRDRVLAAGAGREPSLLRPDARAWALARRMFPAGGAGALLVVPDAFLARADSAPERARRAASLRCESARGAPGASCPAGGTFGAGDACSIHGPRGRPVPLGDLPAVAPGAADAPSAGDPVAAGAVPVAALWDGTRLQVLEPPGEPGRSLRAIAADAPDGALEWR